MLLPLNVFAANNQEKLEVVYFYSSKCLTCRENKAFIEKLSSINGVELIKYDTDSTDCVTIQASYAKHFNVSDEDALKIPYIYFANESYNLLPENHDEVLNKILKYVRTGDYENFDPQNIACEKENVFQNIMNKMTVPGILLAGLIDGVNPCAISMLMVFYSFLLCTENKKKMFLMSCLFIIGIFSANFLFGLGVKQFYGLFAGNNAVIIALYSVAIAMCLTAIVLNTIDIINSKKQKEAKNQLPDKIKFKISNLMRNSIFSKFALLVMFGVGFIIGAIELACTGQIYFPTLTYMIQNGDHVSSSIFMLFAYNVMFVLPLICITVIAALYKNPENIKNAIMKKNWLIKIIANVFFVIMTAILLVQIFKI
jgi:cytochrome c biogenesis protein CcdA